MFSAAQIVAENQLAGSNDWVLSDSASGNIEGFAKQFTVNHGETVEFKIDTDADDYRLDIYRMGWYGGSGGRKVATVQPTSLQSQPNPLLHLNTNATDASNWHVSARWTVPTTAISGVYVAKLIREDGVYGENHIIFVVRDDEGHSDLLFQTSDTSWQAYNTWGGSSLYSFNSASAYAVSYSRPFANQNTNPTNFFFGEEYALLRYIERNGYDVSYISGIDTDRRGAELLEHKVFISVGHDEYWSGQQRANVEAARDAGVNLTFFSGNDVFWKVRWEQDASGAPMMVCYKETHANAKIDPLPGVWTGTWRDPRFAATTDGGEAENSLTGTIFTVNSGDGIGTSINVSDDFAALRFWRDTAVAELGANEDMYIGDAVLGYEWNEDLDNGFRPAGLIPLSETTRSVKAYIQDYGNTYARGTATHSMTMYRAASGALVFSAGTIQYAWALDNYSSIYDPATDRNLQQATVNLFADMGAQPLTLMSGLVRATASADSQAPVSFITSPLPGAVLAANSSVTIRGTAHERGGGRLAVVEVSVDGGLRWHRATGRENWTYTFTTRGSGQLTIMSRAVDDSGNIEVGGPRVDVNPPQTSGVYSLFRNSDSPATVDSGDGQAVELGVRFVSQVDGTVTAIRFYKSGANTGTHVGSLWTNNGQLLARVTFTNETASGWQQMNFSAPVAITAGTTYMVSYFAPNGHFSVDRNYFQTQGVDNGPLHGVAQGGAGPNGVYKYATSSVFPTESYQSSNYWVDVVLNTNASTDNTAPTVRSFEAADGSSTLTTDSAILIKFSEAINVSSISSSTVQLLNPDPNSIPGGCCSTPGGWCSGCPSQMGANTRTINARLRYDESLHSVVVTPLEPLSTSSIYTVLVHGGPDGVKDLAGNSVAADSAASFLTPAQPASVQSSIWNNATTPGIADSGESLAAQVGVRFTADADGFISGVRFYKSAANTGTHIGSLWTSNGQLLTTATFTDETASGWQQVSFATPVAITAGTTYVASYYAPNGHTAADRNYFTTPYDGSELNVPANGGVYVYGGAGDFPTNSFQNSNYWVDVVLRTPPVVDSVAPTVAAFTPGGGSTQVALNSSATIRFSESMDSASINDSTVKLLDGGNNLVPVTLTYDAATMTARLTPTSSLAYATTYTIYVTGGPFGVKDVAGNAIAQTVASSFTTITAPTQDIVPPTVISVTPGNNAVNVQPNGVITLTFSEALNAASVDINSVLLLKNATNRVTASVAYNAANRTVTITPASPMEAATIHTVYVLAGSTGVTDLSGNSMVSGFVSSFTTAGAMTSSSLWPNSTTPATVDGGDTRAVELGVKFTANTSGYITGIRFYKSAANTGTHTGSLWSSTGQRLATATFTNETASGWQTVTFATPIAVTAGTTYVASYFAPNGHYAVNRNYFNSAFNSGALSVPNGGGVYRYGNSNVFPNQAYQNSNYWVDVVFATSPPVDATPPTVTSTTPGNNATNIATNASATVVFSEAMDAATISNSSVKILDGSTIVNSSVAYNSGTRTATITPISALAPGRTYTISVVGGFLGVKDVAGNPLAQTFNSTFTTAAAPPADTTPPTVTSFSPAGGATNVSTSTSVTVNFSEALNAASVSGSTVRLMDGGTQVSASVSYNATNRTATITPTTSLSNSRTYTISVVGGANGIKDLAGNALAQTATSTFTTTAATGTTASLWPTSTTPATVDSRDSRSVELGVRFTANTNGYITGIRFYKSAANTGTHVGSLWSSTGQRLATATFTNETASGWQTVTFATPIAVTAGTTYVASYFAPNGHYAVNRNYFNSAFTSGALSVPNGGGVYRYGNSSVFPNQAYQNSNYWVDVLFAASI